MGVQRFRSVEEMPPPWRPADDPDNLRVTAMMLALYRLLAPAPSPGVHRYRSVQEADADTQQRRDPGRHATASPGG